MKSNKYIKFWQKYLELSDWNLLSERIDKSQVLYDSDIPKEDQYFVGVHVNSHDKIATIYHDRKLNDEYVLHELLHVKNPKFTEEQVNALCDKILLLNK